MQYYRGFLDQFLQGIRHGERAAVDGLVDNIRAGAADDEILRAVARLSCQCPKTETETTGAETSMMMGEAVPVGDTYLDILDENLIRDLEYGDWQ